MEFTDEDFAAMKCMVNYARNQTRCSLENAKAFALREGHTQQAIDNAVKFWARYEGQKQHQ